MALDSAQLSAFAAVIDEGSFERAAGALHLTRSAVSQRVKLLEERVGQVLVRRATPCTPTEAGEALYRHARAVALSESDALGAIGGGQQGATRLAIGVNADSLATWFTTAMARAYDAPGPGITFDIHVEDQDHSANLLREGRVMAAVTADPQPVQGCQVLLLGTMASPYPLWGRATFAAGGSLASALWFLSLGFGSRWLAPVFASPRAWRVLDGGTAITMMGLAVAMGLS